MILQELIDTECNRVLDEICTVRYLRKSDVLSRSVKPHLVKARRDVILTLFGNGFRKADIARTLRCHHATVKFWIDDETRNRRRAQCAEYASKRRGNARAYFRDPETNATAAASAQDRVSSLAFATGPATVSTGNRVAGRIEAGSA